MNRKDFIKQSAFATAALYSSGLQGTSKERGKIQLIISPLVTQIAKIPANT
ncbi:hypothetical protein LVD17_24530 [Fulvivirga ulvae]|uniref:hypothetical protein n=1 Tax=Fulvivirga ulvae TaxID=2904245 RepID=UPI001F2BD40F|nr:hypothetical protein [Fulvivirga ulvae]UII31463.1 hypothetical protein LVD17_24530 [Fulvivirga ulvae]